MIARAHDEREIRMAAGLDLEDGERDIVCDGQERRRRAASLMQPRWVCSGHPRPIPNIESSVHMPDQVDQGALLKRLVPHRDTSVEPRQRTTFPSVPTLGSPIRPYMYPQTDPLVSPALPPLPSLPASSVPARSISPLRHIERDPRDPSLPIWPLESDESRGSNFHSVSPEPQEVLAKRQPATARASTIPLLPLIAVPGGWEKKRGAKSARSRARAPKAMKANHRQQRYPELQSSTRSVKAFKVWPPPPNEMPPPLLLQMWRNPR